MNLTTAIESFLLEQTIRGNSPATVSGYRAILGYFRSFAGDLDVETIDLDLLRSYYFHLHQSGLESVSVQSYVRHLRAFLNWLYNSDLIETDFCRKFKLPKAKRPIVDVLTDSEISALFGAFQGDDFRNVRNRAILALFLDAGLRLNELVNIQRSMIHVPERYVIVDGKGNKQRAVPFGNQTRDLLLSYLSVAPRSPALFLSTREEDGVFVPMTEATVKMMFRRLKAVVPRIYPHLLRHTFATRYLENGGNIYTLQMLLGHTSLEMVKRYLHLAQRKVLREFINYSPLDRFTQDSLLLDEQQ